MHGRRTSPSPFSLAEIQSATGDSCYARVVILIQHWITSTNSRGMAVERSVNACGCSKPLEIFLGAADNERSGLLSSPQRVALSMKFLCINICFVEIYGPFTEYILNKLHTAGDIYSLSITPNKWASSTSCQLCLHLLR